MKKVQEDKRQKVLYMGQRTSAAELSPLNGRGPTAGVSIQAVNEVRSRSATPSSSRMVTPPTSPSIELPRECATEVSPFVVPNQEEVDNIPETDI